MRELQFVGVAEDGEHLLLKDTAGGENFLLPVDERLRAASRGDRSRLGQIELALDSPVRPREIQARIRAGETPEEVAAAAGAPLDRVLRFAYPVLQERSQIAGEARRTRIRRSEFANRLGEQVDERLTRQGVDLAATAWDASRREDSIWWVTLTWPSGKKQLRAQWTFDLPGRTLTPANDLAAELQAEQPKVRRPFTAAPFVPAPADPEDDGPADAAATEADGQTAEVTPLRPLTAPPARRAAASPEPADSHPGDSPGPGARVPDPPGLDLPGPDAFATDSDPALSSPVPGAVAPGPTAPGATVAGTTARAPAPTAPPAAPEEPAPSSAATAADSHPVEDAQPAASDNAHDGPPREPQPSAASRSRGRGRKAKVPAWEDIVFGARGPK